MSTALIFAVGVFVTVLVAIAVVLVGLSEAADPDLARPEDLAGWERKLVGESRGDPAKR